MNNKETIISLIIPLVIFYIGLCFISSMVKNIEGFCDVKVSYDYIVYDRLFCEIK